jgi:predicted secreted protein with PEFG-CTERM motif
MKTKAISSFFVLFALVAGIGALAPAAAADHPEVTIVPAAGSSVPGCEETEDGCYIPSTATVDVGGVVIFSNTDNGIHTYTSGSLSDDDAGSEFDTGMLQPDQSYEYTPENVGEFPYFCMLHPWMQGVLIVQEAEAEEDPMDDHGDDKGDDMQMPQGEASATGMLSDGTTVEIYTSVPTAEEWLGTTVMFTDSEHVNYDITVTQNGEEVLNDEGAHHHDGTGMHTTAALSSSDPVDINITFQGYGVDDPKTGPIGDEVVFSNVVPEFGTIAMMILAVAIISIVAVTAKSRVVPRF